MGQSILVVGSGCTGLDAMRRRVQYRRAAALESFALMLNHNSLPLNQQDADFECDL